MDEILIESRKMIRIEQLEASNKSEITNEIKFNRIFITMGKLIKEWVKGILTEDIEKKVVVYAGRFQPFHKGAVFNLLSIW